MIDNSMTKPCVLIHVLPHECSEGKLREVRAGMEEEGIPCSIFQDNTADAITLAYQAACSSPLGVGMGIGADSMCIHYYKLPEREPLFLLNEVGKEHHWRHFGYNAARLVKGIPFKGEPVPEIDARVDSEDITVLIRRIIEKVLRETQGTMGR